MQPCALLSVQKLHHCCCPGCCWVMDAAWLQTCTPPSAQKSGGNMCQCPSPPCITYGLQLTPPPTWHSRSNPGRTLASAVDILGRFQVGVGVSAWVHNCHCHVSAGWKQSRLPAWRSRNSSAYPSGTMRQPEPLAPHGLDPMNWWPPARGPDTISWWVRSSLWALFCPPLIWRLN